MRNLCSAAMVMCFVIAVSQAFCEDQYWPQWRGPVGTGVSSTVGVVSQWGPGQNVKWRIELPQPGNSTPIVWDDRLLFTQPLSEAKQRSLFCVDRETGRELWRRGVAYDQPETLPTKQTGIVLRRL